MAVKRIPDGYQRVIPYLIINNVDTMMTFLKDVFDAEIIERMALPDGTVNHGEVRIVDSVIMMGKSSENYPPQASTVYVYVDDVDSVYKKAISIGANSIMEPTDMFYGDRNAGFADPQGINWWAAIHVEDIARDEMERRNKKRVKQK